MSEFRLPPLVVDYSDLWLEVDLRGDVREWSRRAAGELLARERWSGFRSRRGEKRTAELLEQAAGIARRFQGATMCLLLMPSPGERIQATVHFSPVDLAGREGADAWDGLIGRVAPQVPGEDPPEITSVESKAGECRRARMRYAAGDGPERPVGEHIAYMWVFTDYGAAVIMTTSITSILDAARWLPALDQLAADCWLQRAPDGGPA